MNPYGISYSHACLQGQLLICKMKWKHWASPAYRGAEAQKRIINVARRLSDERSIVLAGRGGDDFV